MHSLRPISLLSAWLLFALTLTQASKEEYVEMCKKINSAVKYMNKATELMNEIKVSLNELANNDEPDEDEKSNKAEKKALPVTPAPKTTPKIKHSEVCANFEPVPESRKTIACFLGKSDLDSGIIIGKVIGSRLCTDVYLMVPFKYDPKKTPPLYKVDGYFDEESLNKWQAMGVNLMVQLGSWDDPERNVPAELSNWLTMSSHRGKLVNAIRDSLTTEVAMKFKGLLISWYYPACPREDCKNGKATDEHRLIDFLTELRSDLKSNNRETKIALEVGIEGTLVYMGYGMRKLKDLVDIMLFETSSGENRTPLNELISLVRRDTRQPMNVTTGIDEMGSLPTYETYVFLTTIKLRRENSDQPLTILMELETVLPYAHYSMFRGKFIVTQMNNITSKEACLLTKESNVKLNNDTENLQWPHIYKGDDLFTYPEINYLKKFIDTMVTQHNLSGIWIRDLWADDIENECGCGSFPILKVANEVLGRSTCKMPNCPTK